MALSKKAYKGCRDFFPEQMRQRQYLFDVMRKTAEEFGFEAYDGPTLEEVDLYKAKSGEELINDQIYSFNDRGNRHVAIRPEMTPTVARMVAQVHRETPKPFRWYSIPNLMRYERPQKGRLREHWQLNVDIFGAPENLAEIELMAFIKKLMQNFGADSSMYCVLVNDRHIVDRVFSKLEINEESSYKLYKIIDKAKKVDSDKLRTMILEVISEDKAKVLESYLDLNSFEALESFLKNNSLEAPTFTSFVEKAKALGLEDVLQYDPTIVRGLDYYTGVVFEVFDKHPDNRRAIAGGGAYASLLKIFNEPELPGVGLGMGDVTLADFLNTHKIMPAFNDSSFDLYLVYTNENEEKAAFEYATKLRSLGIKVAHHLGAVKFNKAIKTVKAKGFSHMAAVNEDLSLNIKDLIKGESKTINLNDIKSISDII